MAAFLGRKVIIRASILLRKAWLGSKLGDSGSGNPFMWVFLLTDPTIGKLLDMVQDEFDGNWCIVTLEILVNQRNFSNVYIRSLPLSQSV